MSWKEIAELYGLAVYPDVLLKPRYNAAPTQLLPIFLGHPARGEMMQWGFQSRTGLNVNARADTIGENRPLETLFESVEV